MQALSLVLCAAVFAGQAGAPAVHPDWLTDIEGLQREAVGAPLGSLDAKAEQSWAAALAAPKWPDLRTAAQYLASFYDSQGDELKAEKVLRQALAAAPRDDVEARRAISSMLLYHFEHTQQLVKAAAFAEDCRDDMSAARIYERMGELDKAEAFWKRMAAEPVAPAPGARRARSGNFGVAGAVPVDAATSARNGLAALYAAHGRVADAERVYKQLMADAAQRGASASFAAADGYLGFLVQQQRSDEAAAVARGLVAQLEKSPDDGAARTLIYARQRLAGLLAQTGHTDEALAMRRGIAEQAREPSDEGQSLATLAQALIDAKRLDEAEATIEKMRALGRSDPHGPRFAELMSSQMLARVRELQNKPDEARRLRESVGVPDVTNPKRPETLNELAGPAQHKAMRGDLDGAAADARRLLAMARDRVRTNPEELAALAPVAQALIEYKRPADAERAVVEALRLLDSVPDHPRVADALGSLVEPLCRLGLVGEAARGIERQERILAATKGPDSPAMNAVGYGRIALMQRESNWAGIIEERRRMLARVEAASGPRSLNSLYALREVAWAYSYSPADNWPEERKVLENLLDRTGRLLAGQTDLANLYEHMANRASHHGQFEIAAEWAERGIDAARAVPGGATYVQNMLQLHERIRSMMRPQ